MFHCPSCEAISAVGNNAANFCFHCGSLNVAGASIEIGPAILAVTIATVAWFVGRKAIKGAFRAIAARTA